MFWLLLLKQNNRFVRVIISAMVHHCIPYFGEILQSSSFMGYLTLTDEATLAMFFLIYNNLYIKLGVG